MLGAAGCIAPEILASAGAIPQSPSEVLWFKSGVIPPAGTYERGYWADPFSLFWLEVVAMQFAELKRWQDYRHPGSQGKQYFLGMENAFNGSGDPAYPGGPWFNLFNLGKTEADMKVLKTKEVRRMGFFFFEFFCFPPSGAERSGAKKLSIILPRAIEAERGSFISSSFERASE